MLPFLFGQIDYQGIGQAKFNPKTRPEYWNLTCKNLTGKNSLEKFPGKTSLSMSKKSLKAILNASIERFIGVIPAKFI